ncbi:MAG: DUF4097 family beta strand repeat protein [Candidatus Bathyarchaeota archaeon]|nr:MAG: DUF4097 family beta strand repeat protein [Candidatus Bathyarchaeota archaeon]
MPDDAKFCSSCGASASAETETKETIYAMKVTDKPRITVMNSASGSIEVTKGSETEVNVKFDLLRPEALYWDVSQDGNTVTVSCRRRSSVNWIDWPIDIFSAGPRAKIHVAAPVKSDLTLENRTGKIMVSGIKGEVSVESSAGALRILDCEGAIRARTKAGSIDMEHVDGTVHARSSAGSIRYHGTLSKGENWFRTSVGSIDLVLQGEPDLQIEASTMLGSIKCRPDLADARMDRGRLRGSIGTGTGRLYAETKTGRIAIRH